MILLALLDSLEMLPAYLAILNLLFCIVAEGMINASDDIGDSEDEDDLDGSENEDEDIPEKVLAVREILKRLTILDR